MQDHVINHTNGKLVFSKWSPITTNIFWMVIPIFILAVFAMICISFGDFISDENETLIILSFIFLFLLVVCTVGVTTIYLILNANHHNKNNSLLLEEEKFNEDQRRYNHVYADSRAITVKEKFEWEKEKYENEKMFNLFEEFIKANKPTEEKKMKLWEEIGEKLDRYVKKRFSNM